MESMELTCRALALFEGGPRLFTRVRWPRAQYAAAGALFPSVNTRAISAAQPLLTLPHEPLLTSSICPTRPHHYIYAPSDRYSPDFA